MLNDLKFNSRVIIIYEISQIFEKVEIDFTNQINYYN